MIFWSACVGILFFGMAITTLGSIVPDLKNKFGLSDISIGALFTILPFGILAGSLFFGPISDRFGYRILLSIACISMFLGFEGIAFSSSLSVLNICIFLFGLGGGAINGATSALIADISPENKGANLSFLGVFFGLGALTMPFILGFLQYRFSYQIIVSIVGFATLGVGIFYLLLHFPAPKQSAGFLVKEGLLLIKNRNLLLIAFFLFFQSAFEGIINNWVPTFLTTSKNVSQQYALYALSVSVVGMVVMRLLLGSIFRGLKAKNIWLISFASLFLGLIFLGFGEIYVLLCCGLFLIGAGLAAGFPIMLGYVGNRFKELSGTAFSIAFVIALSGNMIINYTMGIIAQRVGIQHLITVGFVQLFIMIILTGLILRGEKFAAV
ncbi:MAG: MFS transporter [Ginsengibacter sp.]